MDEELDELINEAVELVTRTQRASIQMLQRQMRIGYTRAARILEQLEKSGVVGPAKEYSVWRDVYLSERITP